MVNELVEWNEQSQKEYDDLKPVFLFENEDVCLSVVKKDELTKKLLRTERINGKKYGVYWFSDNDIEQINTNTPYTFYHGKKTNIQILKVSEVNL
jgi:hypothetical protein